MWARNPIVEGIGHRGSMELVVQLIYLNWQVPGSEEDNVSENRVEGLGRWTC